jgi:hypothetical protein
MRGTAAIGHRAAVFFAMIRAAIMRGTALVMGAMIAAAIGGSSGFVMFAMFGAALVGAGVSVLRAMLGADFVFSARMIGTMFCAIVLGSRFVGAVFQTGFVFFTFVFGAMLDAVMRCGIGFMFSAVFRRHGGCRWLGLGGRGGLSRCSGCWRHYRRLSSCFDRFCRFAARQGQQSWQG